MATCERRKSRAVFDKLNRNRIARRRAEEEGAEAFPSASDDEVGGYEARSAPAMFAPPICRRSR